MASERTRPILLSPALIAIRLVVVGVVGCFCSGALTAQAPSRVVFRATVKSVEGGGVLLLEDGRRVGLQGLTLPSDAVRPKGYDARLKAYLEKALRDAVHRVWIIPDTGEQPGVDVVASVHARRDEESLNAAVLRRGLAVYACRTPGVIGKDKLLAAARAAQRARAGWFGQVAVRVPASGAGGAPVAGGAAAPVGQGPRGKRGQPYRNGAVLGLHHQSSKTDYHRQIDELEKAGFRHLGLLFSVFVEKVDSVAIRRDHVRTVRDPRLIETIGYAKKKGFSVMLLPIVLILHPGDDDWRGLLRPRDEDRFWQNYDRFLAHYADISEKTGVDLFCVGSELGSLENRTETWLRLIENVRGRFSGDLTYSANWDHADTPRFFKALDVVGMTAYFSLTKKKDPSLGELEAQWRRVAKEVARTHAWHGRPVIFTELGYPSQNGINRDPWNYTMDTEDIDLREQADCFEAFLRVAPSIDLLRGAYFYDYYDLGGVEDWSYSPRGKPAMNQWRRWASRR